MSETDSEKLHIPYHHLTYHTSIADFQSQSQSKPPDFVIITARRTDGISCAEELLNAGFGKSNDGFWRNTTVVAMQNGARLADEVSGVLGKGVDVVEGIWTFTVREKADGQFEQVTVSSGPFYVTDSTKGRKLAEILSAVGLD
ncbi:hypothetical protein HDU76_005770, partial [Blyttiomyces sp. JEL0837]